MNEHPGTAFRDGPARRRAALASGPDVPEVAHAVKPARSTEPEPAGDRLPGLIADNTGTPLRLIRTAIRYRPPCPRSSTASHAITQRDFLDRERRTHCRLGVKPQFGSACSCAHDRSFCPYRRPSRTHRAPGRLQLGGARGGSNFMCGFAVLAGPCGSRSSVILPKGLIALLH